MPPFTDIKPLTTTTKLSKVKMGGESTNYEALGCLHEWFSRDCKQYYGKTAVYFEGMTQTYEDLDHNSSMLAAWLQIEANIIVGDLVVIYLPKCLSFPTCYIGIMKAGGAYLPLDVSNPDSLLVSVLQDATPKAIITTEKLAKEKMKGIQEQSGVTSKLFIIDDEGFWREELDNGGIDEELGGDAVQYIWNPPKMQYDDLAFAVYSSGTTGKPKGILCPHRGAVFSYNLRHVDYPYSDEVEEREACNVFFVWEMLRPLLKGKTLYIIPETTIYDPKQLILYFIKHKITRVLLTPSLLEVIINARNLPPLDSLCLRHIVLCGEVVTTKLLEKTVAQIPNATIVNLYSVSECHDVAMENLSLWRLNEEEEERKYCPVGRIFNQVSIAILSDDTMELQPVGVAGEIYVGGPTLARGYLNREELTRQRFIDRPSTVPASFGSKLYRTGDWGYLLANNKLEICGRCDSMVKIRGYSIELKAVENALSKLPMVENCVVLAEGNEGDDKYLVAYVILAKAFQTADSGDSSTAIVNIKREIRSKLKTLLPFYMIPATFMFMDQLPVLESSAKMDKKQLPSASKETSGGSEKEQEKKQLKSGSVSMSVDLEDDPHCLPSNAIERKLHKIWRKVLHLKTIDVTESFFDLGGHSLAATYMLEQVYDQLNVELRVHELFQFPSIVELAKLIESRRTGTKIDSELFEELDLNEEVEKYEQPERNFDMQLRAFWRSFSLLDTKWKRAHVLLTGATGFLGGFILQELLLRTQCNIFCIVRDAGHGVSVESRLRRRLEEAMIMPPQDGKQPSETQEIVADAFDSRVTVIKADLSLEQLGVDEETYNMLQYEVDIIIHAAAQVNLVYPYTALRRANVFGTQNIIKLAGSAKIKPLHYISTNAIFPARPGFTYKEEEDLDQYANDLTEGYGQSKWVSEQLVCRARERGFPIVVYRPGNIGGDFTNCYWNPQDLNLALLQAITATGCVPSAEWVLEETPADYLARFIVCCMQDIRAVNGKTFNLVQPQTLDDKTLIQWMTNFGYKLETKPVKEWIENIISCKSAKLKPAAKNLLKELNSSNGLFTLERTNFSVEATCDALKMFGMPTYPVADNDYLQNMFTKQIQRNILERPPKSLSILGSVSGGGMDKLKGKVAIVTGASSGFGKAISILLAKQGVKVGMAARRLDKLKEVSDAIISEGGQCVAVQTDVTTLSDVQEMHRKVELALGPIDILVNNAGYMQYTEMKTQAFEEWDKTVDINVKGVNNCVGVALPGMIQRERGHIVNMSSDASIRGFPGLAVYSGTKFYVEGLSQALRGEVSKHNIKVTCIQPGNGATELLNHSTDMQAREKYDSTLTSNHEILSAQEVAQAVLYAVGQPAHVAINEIRIQPSAESF
ncbi:uncharacterized protein LOC142358577 isoform X2 [Convolutriloba macropyga]|uniref:uncharacterized protein LOC142358577 isoform X2 n=1 Tax=Convolutriloba macropyga TaxID=536237 RepID=UPI003F523827